MARLEQVRDMMNGGPGLQQQAGSGSCDVDAKCCARPSLEERVQRELHQAEAAIRRADQLAQLDYLLKKHPDVARILDLREQLVL